MNSCIPEILGFVTHKKIIDYFFPNLIYEKSVPFGLYMAGWILTRVPIIYYYF